MRPVVLMVALLASSASVAAGSGLAGNARELRELLLAGRPHAGLEPIAMERGCGLGGCSTDIDRLSILPERQAIHGPTGRKIRLVEHGAKNRDLPPLDWDPLGGFKVFAAGKRWGTCLEFAHAGVGKSGPYQRWTSVVLVPGTNAQPGAFAHRFVGYWAGCDLLVKGPGAGEVSLPAVEPLISGQGQLHLVWYRCTARRCVGTEDSRQVSVDAASESGALVVKAPRHWPRTSNPAHFSGS